MFTVAMSSELDPPKQNEILIEMKEIANKPSKKLSKHLIRPFAQITFFNQAVRIAFDDLNQQLTEWNDTKDPLIPSKIYDSFDILIKSISLHKQEHCINGLYPEIESTITNKLNDKQFEQFTKTQLEDALSTLSSIIEQQDKDTQLIKQVKKTIAQFASKIEKNKNKKFDDKIDELFNTMSDSIQSWMKSHQELLQKEEQFLSPLIDSIADNKVNEIRIVKGITAGTHDLILEYQFKFNISKLVKCHDWICPITKQPYIGNETLAAYIYSFQLTNTVEEYESIRELSENNIPETIWEDLKLYGLNNPGLFRYRNSTVTQTSVECCVCWEDQKCIVL